MAEVLISVFISMAVNMIMNALFKEEPERRSPTYSDQLATSTSNGIVIPLVYGTVKQAGNLIYQKVSADKTWNYKIVCFGYGEIKDISDIRINDLSVSGSNYSTSLFIWNTSYSNSRVGYSGGYIRLISSSTTYININGKSWDVIASEIGNIGGGWQVSSQGLSDGLTLNDLGDTYCYNSPVGITVNQAGSSYSESGFRKYLGTGNQLIDDIVEGNSQYEKALLVGGLKYDSYISVWAKASEQINGDFNVTALVHGRVVRIYTSPYIYHLAWSDNPAWCILDFLTCYNGVGLKHSQLDIQSFINSANYCDQLITNIDGTKQKRFTLNYVLDEKKSRLDWIADMMRVCQAYPTFQNGKYGIMVEQPQNNTQSFDSNTINDLELWWSPMEEIVDVLNVKYIEPSYDWAKIMANAEADKYLRDFPYTYDIEALGVTNFSQASRLSWFYMNQSQTCTTWCKFKTDRRAIARSIGDVISISDYIVQWDSKKFRIMQMSEAQDDKIEVTCREYNPLIYSDTFGSVKPTINHSALENPFDKPPSPYFYTLDQTYYIQKDKRNVMAYITAKVLVPDNYSAYKDFKYWYSDNDKLNWKYGGVSTESTFNIHGMEIGKTYYIKVFLENYYGILSEPVISSPIYFSGNNTNPSPVENFTVTETIGGFSLNWKSNTELDLEGYNIYIDGNVSAIFSNSTSYFYPTTNSTSTFIIRALDTAGNLSEAVGITSYLTIPSQVVGFNSYNNGSDIDFVWEQNSGENVSYEIRRGLLWDTGQVVARVNGGFAKVTFAPPGSSIFWIKAKSLYGVYGIEATWSTLEVAPYIDRNCIFTTNASYIWEGAKFNTDVISGGLQLRPNCIRGEYMQEINLPYKCNARNWIDSSIIAVVSDGIDWGSANFSWEGSFANSVWLPRGSNTQNISVKHQISMEDSIPNTCIESFPLDYSTIGQKGTESTREEKVTYDYGRFKNGAMIKDNTFLKWDTINIPSNFSLAFTIKLDVGMYGDVGYLTLRNSSNNWLLVGFNTNSKCFYLLGSDGNKIELPIEFELQDFITLGISQTTTTRRLLGYSLSNGNKVSEEISASSLGLFTSMALYANI